MNQENFKICCRAIYPNCIFENNHPVVGTCAYFNTGVYYHPVACFSEESGQFVLVSDKKNRAYIKVTEEDFVKELDRIRKEGLNKPTPPGV